MDAANRRLRAIQRTLAPSDKEDWMRVLVLPDNAAAEVSVSPGTTSPLNPDGTGPWRRIAIAGKPVCAYRSLPITRSLVISAIGTPYENSAHHIPKYPVFELAAAEPGASIAIADAWGALNVLHTLYHAQETIPVVLSAAPAFANAPELTQYLLRSGLARRRHALSGTPQPGADAQDDVDVLFLLRQTFWQGAGVAGLHARGWLRAAVDALPGTFPYVHTLTRTPLAIAGHPLRPPKPAPGEVVFRRWIPSVGQMLEFVAFDLGEDRDVVEGKEEEASEDLRTLSRWHNTDYVNRGWGDRGPIEKHRDYVRGLMRDPAVFPLMMKWDGIPFGYTEMCWLKENHVAPYIPGGGDEYDRGAHVLVGEPQYRGLERSKAWMGAIHHYEFLADPRTKRVLGEPKAGNPGIMTLSYALSMHLERVIDFPYKRSNLTMLPRERYFSMDLLAFSAFDEGTN